MKIYTSTLPVITVFDSFFFFIKKHPFAAGKVHWLQSYHNRMCVCVCVSQAAPDPVLFDTDLVASHGRMLDARCDDDCDLDCAVAVPENRRLDAYREFCAVTAAETDDGEVRVIQNVYLRGCVELRERTVDTDDHIIEQTPEFWLGGDGIKVRYYAERKHTCHWHIFFQ